MWLGSRSLDTLPNSVDLARPSFFIAFTLHSLAPPRSKSAARDRVHRLRGILTIDNESQSEMEMKTIDPPNREKHFGEVESEAREG
jgi:hypothetical protein